MIAANAKFFVCLLARQRLLFEPRPLAATYYDSLIEVAQHKARKNGKNSKQDPDLLYYMIGAFFVRYRF